MRDSNWVRLLTYVTGLVNQRLLLQNEYLIAENRILRSHLPPRLRLSDPERCTLADIGKRLGRKDLQRVASVALPDTILTWYRRLIADKFDGSKRRSYPGRPPLTAAVEALIVRMARENSGWGYDRIAGAFANLGHRVSDQTVGNILRRYGIPPAPKRGEKTTWNEFIRRHMDVLTGTDFFTVEVLTWRGLVTSCLSGCLSKPQLVVWGGAQAGVPMESSRVPSAVRHRASLPAVFGQVPVAGWIRMSALRA
jgi:putative transposase